MVRFFPSAAAACVFAAGSFAQAPAPASAFDTASVKASDTNGPRNGMDRLPGSNVKTSPGSLSMRFIDFRSAVAWAYHVMPIQVSGPDWMDNQRFDIAAKSAGPVDTDTLRLMMR